MEQIAEKKEFLVTIVRAGKRNVQFRVWASDHLEADQKAKERYKGNYEVMNYREVARR